MVTEQKIFLITPFLPRRRCRRHMRQHVHSCVAHVNGESLAVLAVRANDDFLLKGKVRDSLLRLLAVGLSLLRAINPM